MKNLPNPQTYQQKRSGNMESHLTRVFHRVLPIVCFVVCSFNASLLSAQAADFARMTPQERAEYFARIGRESQKSWRHMIELLKIQLPDSLPPLSDDPNRPPAAFQKKGSSGWTDSSNDTYTRSEWGTWNNYDESQANPYVSLPDPLVLDNGRKVADAQTWWNTRRQEIVSYFDDEIYGREPEKTPPVHWSVVGTRDTVIGNVPVVTRELIGEVDNSRDTAIHVDIQVSLTLPARVVHPVPVLVEFSFLFPPGFKFPGMPEVKGPTWQQQAIENGWGYAIYVPTSVQDDNGASLTSGIIGLMNKGEERKPDDWGALRAWAWGAGRVLDYFGSVKEIDSKKVAIEGVSRYGKAVLVTMAYDQRFAIALVGSSGKGGATLFRRNYGESMGNICSSGEFHWFAGNLMKYVLHPENLSVDSHELIALCAPRPVFVSCGSPKIEGTWVDDFGQFKAEAAASPVYDLLGAKGLQTNIMPPIGTFLSSGDLAFRQHDDGHTVGPNWPYFFTFANKYFGSESNPFSK